MKWLRGVIAAAVLTMVAVPAVAQIPSNHNVQFNATNWGTYFGPYTLTNIPGQYQFDAYCVDFYHHVYSGVTWEATYTRIGDGDLRGNARYGDSWSSERFPTGGGTDDNDALRLQYQRSAWLATQFAIVQPQDRVAGGFGQALHHYIWGLWVPDAPSSAWDNTVAAVNNYTGGTARAFDSADFDDWYVVSDVNGVRQEFITPYVNVVPEPATLILMGTGLVAVMGMTVVMRQSVG